jgi:hypothetical protein
MKRGFLNTERADDDVTLDSVSNPASHANVGGKKVISENNGKTKEVLERNGRNEDDEAEKNASFKADASSIVPLPDISNGKDSVGSDKMDDNTKDERFDEADKDYVDNNNKDVETDTVSAVPVPDLPNGLENSDETGIVHGNHQEDGKFIGIEPSESSAAAEEPDGGDDKHANSEVVNGTAKDKEDATHSKSDVSPASQKHRYEPPLTPSIPVPPIPCLVGNPGAHTVSVTCQTVACSEGGVRYMFFVEEEEENANGERIRHSAVGVPDADCKTISATMVGIRPGRPHKLWSVLCTELHGELHGQPIGFTSAPSHPDPPQAPVVSGKQKNSIKFR